MGSLQDLTGQRFGRLTATTIVTTARLNRGQVKSCGCLRNKTPSSKLDLTGLQFGRLTVAAAISSKKHLVCWKCVCTCGTIITSSTQSLRSGNTKSCGCLKLDMLRHRSTTHGFCSTDNRHELYTVYASMKDRCLNPNNEHYHCYGGKGVTICQRWLDSFANFLSDVGDRPSKKHSIDRYPDRKGDYKPGNTRWATQREQMSNTDRNVFLTVNGETHTMMEWSTLTGLKYTTVQARVRKGLCPADVLRPVKVNS